MSSQNFNFSNGELSQRSDKLSILYQRDEADFAKYGFASEDITTLQSNTASLKEMPSDEHYVGLQTMATNAKNEVRARIILNINDLRHRVKLTYGDKSKEYNLFRFSKLNGISDNDLVQFALHICNTAQTRLEALAARMVTQESLDTIIADRLLLDDKIDEQSISISVRREKTLERNTLANDIYKQVSKLSEVGKLIWKGVNEAYYTDYLIYGSPKSMVEQNEVIEEVSN